MRGNKLLTCVLFLVNSVIVVNLILALFIGVKKGNWKYIQIVIEFDGI